MRANAEWSRTPISHYPVWVAVGGEGAQRGWECTDGIEEALGGDGDIEDVDAGVCAQMPLFASAEAAQGWLAGHPGGRVFTVREAWDLSPFRDWRDRMTALLNLD